MAIAPGSCTFDPTVYGKSVISAPKPMEKLDTRGYEIAQRLTSAEYQRLKTARASLIMIGDYLNQEKSILKADKLSPNHYLYPRTLTYNLLKFSEALSPTCTNRFSVSNHFEQTIQTHILTDKLLVRLRDAARHKFYSIDMLKLKAFCRLLADSNVLKNIKAYEEQAEPRDKPSKDALKIHFYARSNIPKKQDLLHFNSVDYLNLALEELDNMGKVGGKIQLSDLVKDNFYLEGLKMGICNVEECIKQLGYTDDPVLREIFYFGNKVAHEMMNPQTYCNEEIPDHRLGAILKKTEVIKQRILTLVNTKPQL